MSRWYEAYRNWTLGGKDVEERGVVVGMDHKAFAFDWERFNLHLHSKLVEALASDESSELVAFIDQHRESLADPYEGEPLPADWRSMMSNHDVDEYGDFALTLYYVPTDNRGVGIEWTQLSHRLREPAASVLLGFPIGPPDRLFDPGQYGSYFQSPELVRESLRVLQPVDLPDAREFVALLERCAAGSLGVYVTF